MPRHDGPVKKVAGWLRRNPIPDSVRVNGETMVRVRPGAWTELERTLRAMGANTLEALDKQGAVIRATEIDGPGSEAPPETSSPATPGLGSIAKAFGEGVGDVPEMVMLAEVIASAVERGVRLNNEAHSESRTQANQLTSFVLERLQSIETAFVGMLNQRLAVVEEREADVEDRVHALANAEKPGGNGVMALLEQVVQTRVASMVGGGGAIVEENPRAVRGPVVPPNGKAG